MSRAIANQIESGGTGPPKSPGKKKNPPTKKMATKADHDVFGPGRRIHRLLGPIRGARSAAARSASDLRSRFLYWTAAVIRLATPKAPRTMDPDLIWLEGNDPKVVTDGKTRSRNVLATRRPPPRPSDRAHSMQVANAPRRCKRP